MDQTNPDDEVSFTIPWLLILGIVIIILIALGIFILYQKKVSLSGLIPTKTETHSESANTEQTTGGTTGKKIIKGPSPDNSVFNDQIFKSIAISPSDPNIVYVGTEGNGAFKTSDGGKNWSWLRQGFVVGKLCDTNQESYGKLYGMVIDPTNEQNVYAAMTCGPEVPSENSVGGIYKSSDGGTNWTQKLKGLENSSINSLAIDLSGKILFAGTNGEKPAQQDKIVPGGIYKSTDGGESWSSLIIPEKGRQNRFDTIVVRDNSVFALGLKWKDAGNIRLPDTDNALGLIKSTDQGQTWQNINPSGVFVAHFDVSSDQKLILAATDNGEGFKSINGGSSWTKINLSGPIKINPEDSDFIIFGSLSISKNGLASSQKILTAKNGISDIEFAPSDPKIIYAGGNGYILYKSTDGGNTFEKIANLREFIDSQS